MVCWAAIAMNLSINLPKKNSEYIRLNPEWILCDWMSKGGLKPPILNACEEKILSLLQ
ncbi:hypothetical protein [Desmonostoc muscorum]|uniref:hypothetical protein n=1 Tax=Desmonostoc muscorum TaxID=1179 RepID=UPI001F4324D7|nr:hypothetical protein [Desmonostoc muscorum]